jgi:hypothetical protein
MRIEVGKRYVRRDGSVTQPLVLRGSYLYDKDAGYFYDQYQDDGWRVFPGENHFCDLMVEYHGNGQLT